MVCRTDSVNAFSRHAYIYPSATLGDLAHGDSIRMIEFFKTNDFVYAGTPNFKMYVGMSDSADFGAGNIQSWSTETSRKGVQKVFDGSIQSIVDATAGYKAFAFDTMFVFDTTQGSHLKILVEFYQNTAQTVGLIPLWAYENNFSVTGFVSNNETKYIFGVNQAPDSTIFTQVRKPSIRIHFPRYDTNAAVNNVYALGELALLMAPVDTIKFNVRNTGKKVLHNHPFEVAISGANSFRDTVYVDTLLTNSDKMLFSHTYKPKNKGVDTVTVRSLGDPYSLDDTTVFLRKISHNVLSHNNPFVTNAAFGIGFNGSSGDFIAKYYTDSNYINQIKIGFSSSGQPFMLGIWQEDSNGGPGKEIYTSDTLLSNGGQYIQPVLPKVQVRDGYFVGIRQLGTQNIAFNYEAETPVRPGVFYFAAPARDTNWTSFSPGFDFNFDIQPRIQIAHDVAVIGITYPADLDTFEFSIGDSIKPKAIVYNYGVKDQNNPFDVVCEILDQFNNVVYKSIKIITLDAEDSLEITFDKPFSLGNYGDLRMLVYTKLSGDLAIENDSLAIDFSIYVNYDIQVESFFEPVAGTRFELNKDKVSPTVRMVNFGSRDQSNIRVTSRIRQDTKIAKEQTQTISLAGGGSQILAFDSVTIPFAGDVIFEVFCWNAIDSFPVNDTARVTVEVVRSNDLGIVSIIRPRDSSIYERNQVFRPYLNYRNFGLGDQDSTVVTCAITDESGSVIYRDTVIRPLPKFSTIQALFKDFKAPNKAQTLTFDAKTWIAGDQDTTNDRISTQFFIKTKTDLALVAIKDPVKDSLYLLGDTISPKVTVVNIGNTIVPATAQLFYRIVNSTGAEVYFDSTTIGNTLAIDNRTDVNFPDFVFFNIKDAYNAVCFIKLPTDGEAGNDTLRTNFNASAKNSISLGDITLPTHNQVYQLNIDTVFPSFSIVNSGLNDISNPVYYTVTFNNNGSEVYRVSDSITVLLSETSIDIQPMPFVPLITGKIKMKVTIQNVDDEIVSDNELERDFFVSLQNDVAPIAFVYPEIDSLVFANRTYAPKGQFRNLGDSAQRSEFSVSYIISLNGTQLYNSNKNITLDSGSPITVGFDSTFTPTTPGTYDMFLITRLGIDQVLTNDTLTGSFVVDFHSSAPMIQSYGVKLYPNPSNSTVFISSTNSTIKSVEVFSANGRIIEILKMNHNKSVEVDVTHFVPGFYWFRIEIGDKFVWQKVITN